MTSVFEASRAKTTKGQRKANEKGQYIGPVEKIPNMKNAFIRHIFNVKRQRDIKHANSNYSRVLEGLTPLTTNEINNLSIRDICTNKFLSYLYALSHNIPTTKIYHYGKLKDLDELPDDCVIKFDRGMDGVHVLCLKHGQNLYDEQRDLAWKEVSDIHPELTVVVEELLENKYQSAKQFGANKQTMQGLIDYKVFSFNGNAEFLSMIVRDKEREIIKSYWYDLRNDISLTENFNYDIFPNKRELATLKEYTKKLKFSKSFFVRIDFYLAQDGIKFGEFTLRPGNFYKGWRIAKVNKNIIDLFAERMDLNNVPYPPPPAY